MAGDETYSVGLTAEELVLLDGRTRPAIQAEIDRAKLALSIAAEEVEPNIAKMVMEAVTLAKETGALCLRRANIRTCHCCGKSAGYRPVTRNTRWKVKGQPDYDKPMTMNGWEMKDSFIIIQGSVFIGGCDECMGKALPVINRRLASIPCELPPHWPNPPHRYSKLWHRMCTACNWIGNEGEMRTSSTLMGDGRVPTGCPQCDAQNTLFGQAKVKRLDSFDLVPKQKARTDG